MKSIFITGGGGYVGHVLVPRLLNEYLVTVYDTFYFQNNLKEHKNLNIIKGDIRDTEKLDLSISNHDIFINLACFLISLKFLAPIYPIDDLSPPCN